PATHALGVVGVATAVAPQLRVGDLEPVEAGVERRVQVVAAHVDDGDDTGRVQVGADAADHVGVEVAGERRAGDDAGPGLDALLDRRLVDVVELAGLQVAG